MHHFVLLLFLASFLAWAMPAPAADLLDVLKKKSGGAGTNSLGAVSEEEMIKGLKEALAKGVQYSITNKVFGSVSKPAN